MQRIPFSFGWERVIGGGFGFFGGMSGGDKVDLPDDYVINLPREEGVIGGPSGGYFPGGQASYTKKFQMPADWANKTVLLDIDGAYMNSGVTLNAEPIGFHPYGYTPFFTDLSQWLEQENKLVITTQNRQPNSRWYSGGGLYRSVDVLIGGKCYIHPWSVYITTPNVCAERAVIKIEAGVTNATRKLAPLTLTACIYNGNGKLAARGLIALNAPADSETKGILILEIERPDLWDTENPNLYTVVLEILEDGETVDSHSETIGIRKIEIDARNGMRLNGAPIKLRGGCIHHDNALLGAAAYPAAEERKIRILKDAGYNAIRTAHNPPSRTMLDICDRLGMLVMDESFDCWVTGKNGNDYHLWFRDWWDKDTSAMVLRDRNRACVFCWSIGNEIGDFMGTEAGVKWAEKQSALVRTLDPSRPVTSAIHSVINFEKAGLGSFNFEEFAKLQGQTENIWTGVVGGVDVWGAQTERAFSHLDIAGYNYIWRRYASDAEKYPDRVIAACETHPFTIYDYWRAARDNPNVIGDFIWTAYDNLGEAGAGRVIWDENDNGFLGGYPWLSCYQGDMDLDGNRRPQSYYHKIVWGLDSGVYLFTMHPSRTGKPFRGTGWQWYDVFREWTFGDEYIGKPVKVDAYADCDKVEFILNGRSLGFAVPEKYIASMEIPYGKGVLEAVAYRGGNAAARDSLQTSGAPAKIVLTPEKSEISADGLDLAFIKIEILDAENRLVTNAPVEVYLEADGAGKLVGLGSGNPCTDENYGTGKRKTWNGKALAVARASAEAGPIGVTASAPGLGTVRAVIACK